MLFVIILLLLFIAIVLLYVLSVSGRTSQPAVKKLQGFAYAHRGLHNELVPENSMEAFHLAKQGGFGVELDVHLLKDGNLAVFHDTTLIRMTGQEGRIVDLTTDELKNYKLGNTEQTIPLFRDVLELFDGKVPLIVELKAVGNCAALCAQAVKELEQYQGIYCIESFDPRCIQWLKKNRPEIVRGQLCRNFFKSKSTNLPWVLKVLLSNQMLNFLTKPDFVAYKFQERNRICNKIARKFWKLQGVTWTIQTKEEFDTAVAEGWIPIFEGFTP